MMKKQDKKMKRSKEVATSDVVYDDDTDSDIGEDDLKTFRANLNSIQTPGHGPEQSRYAQYQLITLSCTLRRVCIQSIILTTDGAVIDTTNSFDFTLYPFDLGIFDQFLVHHPCAKIFG